MKHIPPRKICYFAGTSGDWGGASRVLFTNLRLLDRSRFSPIVLLSAPGPGEARLRELAIPYRVWGPLTEPGNPITYLYKLFATLAWLRREGVAIVHMNRANGWRPAEIVAARLARIPVVTHFHTVNQDCAPATRWSTAIAAVSAYVAQHSATQGVPASVVYNAVDLERFSGGASLRERLNIPREAVVVSFLGQIRWIKGLEDFVAMAEQIHGKGVRFLIAGACRDKNVIDDAYSEEELSALISHDPRICYCGYVGRVEDIYRTSDIVVVPSRWEEPFGLVCIEAGAAGLPVVATRMGGLPEVIVDGVTGALAEAGDVSALAEKVQILVDDPGLRRAQGNAGRERVEQEFTDKPVRALEKLYDSMVRPS